VRVYRLFEDEVFFLGRGKEVRLRKRDVFREKVDGRLGSS